MPRRTVSGDDRIGLWHRGAIHGSTDAYYWRWLDYEGRHAVRQVASDGSGTSAAIASLYESLSDWTYETERWIERSERYLNDKGKNNVYQFNCTGKTWKLSRIAESTHSGNAAG